MALAASRVEEASENNLAYAAAAGTGYTTRMGARAQLTDPVRLERLVECDQSSSSELEAVRMCGLASDRGSETGVESKDYYWSRLLENYYWLAGHALVQ